MEAGGHPGPRLLESSVCETKGSVLPEAPGVPIPAHPHPHPSFLCTWRCGVRPSWAGGHPHAHTHTLPGRRSSAPWRHQEVEQRPLEAQGGGAAPPGGTGRGSSAPWRDREGEQRPLEALGGGAAPPGGSGRWSSLERWPQAGNAQLPSMFTVTHPLPSFVPGVGCARLPGQRSFQESEGKAVQKPCGICRQGAAGLKAGQCVGT